MFDAIGTGEMTNGSTVNKKSPLPDNNGTSNPLHDAGELFEGKAPTGSHPLEEGYSKFDSAILSPSSAIHKASPQIQLRQTALNPNSAETDKDTAQLVEEDKSEC